MLRINLFFFSLIILVENFGYIFWRKNLNLKYLVLLINLKYLLKKSGQNIKVMRFNKEDKFTSKKFEEHYENHEIRWPLTISYFPQQNSVFERKNCSLNWRCIKNFGLKQLIVWFICQIVPLIEVYGIKYHNKLRIEES